MIDDIHIPERFERKRTDGDGERFRAELPNHPTHWDTDDTYEVRVAELPDDYRLNWVATMHDPFLDQLVRETGTTATRGEAETAAIGLMQKAANIERQASEKPA